MTSRRTSNYTAHFNSPEAADIFTRNLDVPVQDHGALSITFRAADDEAAVSTAFRATIGPVRNYTLTTGLGVHRREVWA